MKKYQLIGHKNVLTKSKQNVSYPTAHLCSLPVEILLEIFNCFENELKTLLKLSLACNKFHFIINKNFLYNDIIITTPKKFSKFSQTHLPSASHSITRRFGHNEPSNNINLIKTVHFVNPPTRNSTNRKTKIAGTYDVESVHSTDEEVSFDEYIISFKSLLKEAYGLKIIIISEISPEFSFPNDIASDTSSVFSSFKAKKPSRTLGKLVLKAQSGWSIPFRISHISSVFNVYDSIDELVLHNFVVDDLKLSSNSSKIGINKLTLHSCIYSNGLSKRVPNQRKKCPDIFTDVTELGLLNILSGSDLSIIDVVKQNGNLSKLTLDLDSQIFYLITKNSNMEKQFNFARYNLFFKLLCSGQGSYANLNELELINFDLFDSFRHKHKIKEEEGEETDDWVAPLTDTFETLLTYISTIRNLTIVLKQRPKKVRTCVKCGFTKSEQPDKKIISLNDNEWSILLHPLLSENEDCTVKISDHKGNRVFVRSKYI